MLGSSLGRIWGLPSGGTASAREKTRETSLDRAKSAREKERERERERERMTRRGCLLDLAESGNALFFTIAFIP